MTNQTPDNSRRIRAPLFRMSYCNLIDAKPFDDGKKKGDPVFSTEMILAEDSLEKFQVQDEDNKWEEMPIGQILAEIARAEWNTSAKELVANRELQWPIVDGDRKADEAVNKKGKSEQKVAHYRGHKIMKIKSSEKFPPDLYVKENGELRQLDLSIESDKKKAKGLFVSGYYAVANILAKPIEVNDDKYIALYANAVMFIKKGERIGGRSGEDLFGGIDGGESDYDPTGGNLDEEIPF